MWDKHLEFRCIKNKVELELHQLGFQHLLGEIIDILLFSLLLSVSLLLLPQSRLLLVQLLSGGPLSRNLLFLQLLLLLPPPLILFHLFYSLS